MRLEELFEKALKAAQEGELQKAEDLYKQCLQIEPNHPEIWNNLGNVYRRLGQIAKSIEAYQKAIELDSSYAPAYFNLASTFFDVERYDMAKLFLIKVKTMNFDTVRTTAMLIVCHLQLNEEIEALRLFKEGKTNPQLLRELGEYGILNQLEKLHEEWKMI